MMGVRWIAIVFKSPNSQCTLRADHKSSPAAALSSEIMDQPKGENLLQIRCRWRNA
jgi:hypothetical protein